jgi:hypothetical protein
MKSNKFNHEKHLEESVEWILENRAGWTQFTTWAREKYHINNRQANDMWKSCWEIMSKDFDERIKHTVNEALMELEQLKEDAIINEDRRIWLEVIKYQNKIKGGEIERIEAKIDTNVKLSWGNELTPEFGNTEIL